AFSHLLVSVSIEIPIISILSELTSLCSFTNFLLPNRQGPHQDAQKSISIYFPWNDVKFTSLLLMLFSVIAGNLSPTFICAFKIKVFTIMKNVINNFLIFDYLIVSTVFPQVNIIEP